MYRTTSLTAFFVAAGMAFLTTAASAHGGGGGGGMGGMSGRHGSFGGNSAGHISAQGLAHTNGPNATDRDFGNARAADVRSVHAHAMSHASHAGTSSSAMHTRSHRTAAGAIPRNATLTSI